MLASELPTYEKNTLAIKTVTYRKNLRGFTAYKAWSICLRAKPNPERIFLSFHRLCGSQVVFRKSGMRIYAVSLTFTGPNQSCMAGAFSAQSPLERVDITTELYSLQLKGEQSVS